MFIKLKFRYIICIIYYVNRSFICFWQNSVGLRIKRKYVCFQNCAPLGVGIISTSGLSCQLINPIPVC